MSRELVANILEFFFKDDKRLKYTIAVLAIVALILIFSDALIIVLFLILGPLSMLHMMYTRSYIGFELCTLGTIICSMQYGVLAGIGVGVFSITLGLFFTGSVDQGIVLSIIGFMLIAVFASFFSSSSILLVGVVSVLCYDAMILSFYLITGSNPVSTISYFITHTIINYYIFKYIAPTALSIINYL